MWRSFCLGGLFAGRSLSTPARASYFVNGPGFTMNQLSIHSQEVSTANGPGRTASCREGEERGPRMNRRGKATCLILLLAIITFSVVNTALWLRLDARPPRWDEAGYLTLSLKHHAALTAGGVGALVKSLLRLDHTRPPLVPALAVPAYLLFGRQGETAFAVNLGAFVVALLAVYGLGARLASPWCGLLAAA